MNVFMEIVGTVFCYGFADGNQLFELGKMSHTYTPFGIICRVELLRIENYVFRKNKIGFEK